MARAPHGADRDGIIACDVLQIDLVDLRRVYALLFLEHGTRRLHLAGVTAHPTAQWTVQQARDLAVDPGVRLESLRSLVRDRDGKYADSFAAVFESETIEVLRTAPRSPRRTRTVNGASEPCGARPSTIC